MTPTLALAAHHLGGAPDARSWLVLALTGPAVLGLGVLLRGARSPAALTGLLALGQLGAHLGLALAMGHGAPGAGGTGAGAMVPGATGAGGMAHGAHAMAGMGLWPSPTMLVAHAAAVVLAALLVVGADRVAPGCARVLRRLAAVPVGFVPRTTLRVRVRPAAVPVLRAHLVTTTVLRRGPPVRA